MGASVRIEDEAFSDERYEDLATYAGLADADHARGKMAKLWRQCTIEQTYFLGNQMVSRVLGPDGIAALVKARLGEVTKDGRVRIRGSKGRIEWLSKLRENGKKGGRPKKLRDTNEETRRKPSGFENQNPPAPAPAPAPAPSEERESDARAVMVPPTLRSLPEEPHVEHSAGALQNLQQQVDQLAPIANARNAHPRRDRGAVARAAWNLAARTHSELKLAGVDGTAPTYPLTVGTENKGWKLLLDRVDDVLAGSEADRADEVFAHRVAYARREAERSGSLEYFAAPMLWSAGSFEVATQRSLEQASKPARTERGNRPEEPERRIKTL